MFELRKNFAVPKDFLKSKIYCIDNDFLNDFELSISFERRYTFKNVEKWTFKNLLQSFMAKIGKSSGNAHNQERPFH